MLGNSDMWDILFVMLCLHSTVPCNIVITKLSTRFAMKIGLFCCRVSMKMRLRYRQRAAGRLELPFRV